MKYFNFGFVQIIMEITTVFNMYTLQRSFSILQKIVTIEHATTNHVSVEKHKRLNTSRCFLKTAQHVPESVSTICVSNIVLTHICEDTEEKHVQTGEGLNIFDFLKYTPQIIMKNIMINATATASQNLPN